MERLRGNAVRAARTALSTCRSHELSEAELEQVDPVVRRKSMMVYLILALSYIASVQKNVELFIEVFDKDGDGHVTEVELLTLMRREMPDDSMLASRVAKIFEATDRDRSGGICSKEMMHALMNGKAGRATRLNLLKHSIELCKKLPAPTLKPGANAMRQMEKIRKELQEESQESTHAAATQAPVRRLSLSHLQRLGAKVIGGVRAARASVAK